MSETLTNLNCDISKTELERKILHARLLAIENALGDANMQRNALLKKIAPETVTIDTQEQVNQISNLAAMRLSVNKILVNHSTKTAFALCDNDETDSMPVLIDYDKAIKILKNSF